VAVVAGATGSSLTTPVAITTVFRALVTDPNRSATSSMPAVVTAIPTSVAGTATPSPAAILCGSSATVVLTGQTGTIQWQSSPNNSTWSNVSGATSASLDTGQVTSTTYYRAVVTSGICPSANSTVATATVNPLVAGTASATVTSLPLGGGNSTLSLAGSVGSIQWQVSYDGGTAWSNVSGAMSATYAASVGTDRKYRAQLSNGSCTPVYSNVLTMTVAHSSVSAAVDTWYPPTSRSTSSGSSNEIPGLSMTITTTGGDLEIDGTVFLTFSSVNTRGEFTASIDGKWVGEYLGWGSTWTVWYDGIFGQYAGNGSYGWDTRTYKRLVTGVPAGTHTVKLLAWNESTNGYYIGCCQMRSELEVKELPSTMPHAVAYTTSSFTPPTSQSVEAGSGNQIPGLAVTITTTGGDLEIDGTLFLQWNSAGARGAFSASIDGNWVGSYLGWGSTWTNWYDGIIAQYYSTNWDTRTYHRVVPGVPAGTHTIRLLAWNESSNGWYVNCCSMTSQLLVKELPSGAGSAAHVSVRSSSHDWYPPGPSAQSAAAGSGNEVPGLSATITTTGGDLEIQGTVFLAFASGGYRGAFSASIDGNWVGSYLGWGSSWGNWYDGIFNQAHTGGWDTKSYRRVVRNVPPGTHTVKLLAWNETSNGYYVNCCSMTSELDVRELR